MSNVVPFPPATAIEIEEPIEPRAPYSFEITQLDPGGFVLIDACVPMALAVELMNLVTKHRAD
jgi:hypothetical protein